MTARCEEASALLVQARMWVASRPTRMHPTALARSLKLVTDDVQDLPDAWDEALSHAIQVCAALPDGSPLSKLIRPNVHLTAAQINDMTWHARTFRVAAHRDCYLICGSSALKDAIYTIAKALIFANWTAADQHDYAALDLVIRVLRAQMGALRQGFGWNRSANVILPAELLQRAETIAQMAETFVVLHELAHIAFGHLDFRENIDDVGSDAGRETPSDKGDDMSPEDREHFCDMIAFDALVGLADEDPLPDALLGVELALATQCVLEGGTWWRRPEPHANATRRLEGLAWFWEQSPAKEGRRPLRAWLRTLAVVTATDISDMLLNLGWLGPYEDHLGSELPRRPDVFDPISESQASFYTSMEIFERRIRMPAAGLYMELLRSSRFACLQEAIGSACPVPTRLDVVGDSDSGLEEEITRGFPKFSEEWPSLLGGYVFFNFALLPKFTEAGLFGTSGLTYSALVNLIRETAGQSATDSVLALLLQFASIDLPINMLIEDETINTVLALLREYEAEQSSSIS